MTVCTTIPEPDCWECVPWIPASEHWLFADERPFVSSSLVTLLLSSRSILLFFLPPARPHNLPSDMRLPLVRPKEITQVGEVRHTPKDKPAAGPVLPLLSLYFYSCIFIPGAWGTPCTGGLGLQVLSIPLPGHATTLHVHEILCNQI